MPQCTKSPKTIIVKKNKFYHFKWRYIIQIYLGAGACMQGKASWSRRWKQDTIGLKKNSATDRSHK
jgi:hypothetical protein